MQNRLLVLLAVIVILLLANLAGMAFLVSNSTPEVQEVEVVKEVVVTPVEVPATPSAGVTKSQLRVVSPTVAQ